MVGSRSRRAGPVLTPVVSIAVFRLLERCATCRRRVFAVGGGQRRPRRVWCDDCAAGLLREPST